MPQMARLDRLLARNLGCGRAKIAKLIAAGLVTDEAGAPVTPHAVIAENMLPLNVIVDGDPRRVYGAFHAILNKPAGVVTALRDKVHRVAYDLMRQAPLCSELRAVGRLDADTTGLLLWTTDGEWLHRLTHPKHQVSRTYQVALARPFAPAPADLRLTDGHVPDIVALRPATPEELHPSLARPADATMYAAITIRGGAYHEVRRIFAALGSHVLALCRTRFGPLSLPDDLAQGDYREVGKVDV